MQIATTLSYAGGFEESARQVSEMEKYLAALTERVQIGSGILPIYTRTPTLIAMTAAGVDALSGGRCHLGLGASGPQVIEGWHGVPYEAPIGRTREIVSICRQVWERQAPLRHDGRYYTVPLAEGQGTGLGRPLKIIAHPVRPRIPIWVASLGERNVAMTAEVADGWLPMMFVPEKAKEVWGAARAEGTAKRAPGLAPLMIAAGGLLAIGDGEEITAVRELARPSLALYIGGMGARGRNFYNDLVRRYGYEKEAEEIQDLYLSGKKDEAAAVVPEELLRLTSLCGPAGWVAERIAALGEAGVTHLQVVPVPSAGQTPAELIGMVRDLAG
jgi:F420-dependent oxidoreductase-like protein